jgi:prophage antirepressor-like protein
MSKLISLSYAIHSVRIELINNEPWFCLADVCEILELGNASRVVDRLDLGGVTKSNTTDNLGRTQEVNFINEPNLYRVIFRSNKAEATKFQDWVFNEVLPTIRKTGSYSATPPQLLKIDGYMDKELRHQMLNITRYFRNSSNQISARLWNAVKKQLCIERITDMSPGDYPAVIAWLKNIEKLAYQNYLRECKVENTMLDDCKPIQLGKFEAPDLLTEKS